MNKRQYKKKQQKYLPIYGDEFPLITMTEEELNQAHHEAALYRKKYGYRKKYMDLNRKCLHYFYSYGASYYKSLEYILNRTRKPTKGITISQSLNDYNINFDQMEVKIQ